MPNPLHNPLIERRDQALPRLTPAQIARVEALGRRRQVRAGEILFERYDQNINFYVVLEGRMEIVSPVDGREEPVTFHEPGEFTGELSMLSNRKALVRARMVTDGVLLVVDPAGLRTLVQSDAELSEIIMRAFILRHVGLISNGQSDFALIGSRHSADTLRLKEFLTRNGLPYRYRDLEDDLDAQALMVRFQIGIDEIPLVVCGGGQIFKNPSFEQLADALGLNTALNVDTVRDVVIVGAGPAGLGAAVYAASEGLDVLVLEGNAPGGQAGTSSRIENYLGFPVGISGLDLAGRAVIQAEKFGAEIAVARSAVRLDCSSRPYRIELGQGGAVRTKTVVIASGAQYRRPTFAGLERFEGTSVHYSATHLEAQLCEGDEVAVVGGGNSAGQAAVFLSQTASRVHVLVRGQGLADTMSRYLIRRIEESSNIQLRTRTEITALEGTSDLDRVRWRHLESGETEEHPVCHVFIMTGADPNTDWLQGCLALDAKKFVKTGQDLSAEDLHAARWSLARAPFLMEASLPGVFAVGDIRSNSVKRVASAVGEGSVCVQLLHKAMQDL